MTEFDIAVGFKWKTNNTPRDCYHVVTSISGDGIGVTCCTYETVYPNGMRPFTSGPLLPLVKYLSSPHIGLKIL